MLYDFYDNTVSIYSDGSYIGSADANVFGGFSGQTVDGNTFASMPDGLGGTVFNGDKAGYTLPNVAGGQDIYTDEGYVGTAWPSLFEGL